MTVRAPARIVFEAWTKPELFMRRWAPKSMGVPLLSCDMDVRTGGKYRLEFGQDATNSWAFFGKYIEVIPHSRLVWTNDEDGDGAVTTVTFEEQGGKTLLIFHELYPRRKLSTKPSSGWKVVCPSSSSNWTNFSSAWARVWESDERRLHVTISFRERRAGQRSRALRSQA